MVIMLVENRKAATAIKAPARRSQDMPSRGRTTVDKDGRARGLTDFQTKA